MNKLFQLLILFFIPLVVSAQSSNLFITTHDTLPGVDSVDIDTPATEYLKRQLYQSALTVIKNDAQLPFKELENLELNVICLEKRDEWQTLFMRYQEITMMDGTKLPALPAETTNVLILPDYETYLQYAQQIDAVLEKSNCILVYQGNPSKLDSIINFDKALSIVLTFEDNRITRDMVTQLLYGAISCQGCLPVDVNAKYKSGDGIKIESLGRLKYTMPEELGLNSKYIAARVDSIVNLGLHTKAFPGCRVLMAYKGNVIFNKCYGYHTYDSINEVKEHDVYDLASVTKITGPLPLIMKSVDDKKIDLDQPFSVYWPDWQKRFLHCSNKEDLKFRDVLAHQAQLMPYINYYASTMKKKDYKPKYYRTVRSDKFGVEIKDSLFLKNSFRQKIYRAIRKSPLEKEKAYKYSGLSFMLYPGMLSKLYRKDYEENLYDSFFRPLGASSLCYNPMHKVDVSRVVPTEFDSNYRFMLMKGRVHDEGAAVMGGVSGNAGLFSSAHDLVKLLQMYLQKGEYGGKRYLSKAVVDEFIRVQFPENDNRRGLGFDKPLLGNDTLSIEQSYPAPGVSASSFGHSGFTGTFVWMDPEYDLLYIFLSNRVYPSRENGLIYKNNIRPAIQQVFYDALNMQTSVPGN